MSAPQHSAPPWDPGSAEANRLFYENAAADYDQTEFCAIDEAPRRRLREMLERGLELAPPDAEILDAGGGTGNASLILRELGHETTLIDASPAMVTRWREKAESLGLDPRCELADLETFFADDPRRWGLIVFSSVLHHLSDPAATLASAAGRVDRGGVIITVFDPLAVDRVGKLLRWLDYGLWLALHSPRSLVRAVARRLRPRRGNDTEPNIGALAERHAMSGLDDAEIRRQVEAAGMQTIEHERICDARYRWVVWLSQRLGKATHFAFAFRRPGDH